MTIQWPTVGATFVDSTGRTLEVRSVRPGDRQERHVVGVLKLGGREQDYACSIQTFEVVWSERRVVAEAIDEPLVADPQPQRALYDSRGKALPYTRRS